MVVKQIWCFLITLIIKRKYIQINKPHQTLKQLFYQNQALENYLFKLKMNRFKCKIRELIKFMVEVNKLRNNDKLKIYNKKIL